MTSPALRPLVLGALFALLSPRSRGEDSVSYKYQDYREMGGRVAIRTEGAYVEKNLGTDMRLKVQGILDSIAGATPTGQPAPEGSDQVPLSVLQERRKAWNADFSRQFSGINLAVGIANSRESDYVSTGWSLNTLSDFNQKNTTLLAGVAGTDDDVRVFHQTPWAKKRGLDLILGVTQLLDPRTSLTANVSWGRQSGYLADPYKLVQKDIEILPGISLPLTFAENRPDQRRKLILLLALNRAFPQVHGSIEASYRHYRDDYGVGANTVEVSWFQRLGERWVLRPQVRFHDQSAADFYRYRLDGTSIMPWTGAPRPRGPFFSSDYRLSALQTFTYGLKMVATIAEGWQLDVALERYDMRGTDRVTPQSAYARANMLTGGLRYSW